MYRLFFAVIVALSMQGCAYLLESKGGSLKDIDEDEIEREFADGTRTLPVMFLDTESGKGIKNKESWKDAEFRIYTPEGRTSKYEISVKGRGNSTWSFPKKPFNIKFEDKEAVSLLGMPESSHWCMLANWRDRTNIRNAIALEISRLTSLEWTPRGEFVDLVLDDDWYGNFYLTEKVEPGKLGIHTNGFMIFIDMHYDKTYRFTTKIKKLPVNIITESDVSLNAKKFSEIRQAIDNVENTLYNSRSEGNWNSLLDIQSFCDWFLVQEITGCNEPTHPYGVYMYCKGDGVLRAGPCWDFDFHTFRPNLTGLINGKSVWFDALLSKPEFRATLKARWAELKPLLEDSIPAYIDDTADYIRESETIDHQLWPIKHNNRNGDEFLTFDEAVQRLKLSFLQRVAFLDDYCSAL